MSTRTDRPKESVWDYPRPPRVEPERRHVTLLLGGTVIAETDAALRVLETSHPPTVYLPKSAFVKGVLHPADGTSFCEFKGLARYYDLTGGVARANRAAWSYPMPTSKFETLTGHLAVYPGRVDEAWLDDERVQAQDGDFYGGWITAELVGPFKGGPGTNGW